jgi:hypothetical protein
MEGDDAAGLVSINNRTADDIRIKGIGTAEDNVRAAKMDTFPVYPR